MDGDRIIILHYKGSCVLVQVADYGASLFMRRALIYAKSFHQHGDRLVVNRRFSPPIFNNVQDSEYGSAANEKAWSSAYVCVYGT